MFRRSSRKIDKFGPGDVLLASTKILPAEMQSAVLQIVTDDELRGGSDALLHDETHRGFLTSASTSTLTLCEIMLSKKLDLASAASTMVSESCEYWNCVPKEADLRPELAIAVAAIQGTCRMIELNRPQQAVTTMIYAYALISTQLLSRRE